MNASRRLSLFALAALAAPIAPARAQEPTALDRFLTPPAREAFAAAAQDPRQWALALEAPVAFLKKHGVELPPGVDVAFFDMRRFGDRLELQRPGDLFDVYCPPERTWFSECARIVRACESTETCVQYQLGPHGVQCVEVGHVNLNCNFVCEEFAWDDRYLLATRPPFPPQPRPAAR